MRTDTHTHTHTNDLHDLHDQPPFPFRNPNGTWLPEDVPKEFPTQYLLDIRGYTQAELEAYTTQGITPLDLFMWTTADENMPQHMQVHRRIQAHKVFTADHRQTKIPKPSKGTKKRARRRRRLINKAKHKRGEEQMEELNDIMDALFGRMPVSTHNTKLIKSLMRYQNVRYGSHITKEELRKFLDSQTKARTHEDGNLDYATPQIQQHIIHSNRTAYFDQTALDIITGRCDHLNLRPGQDLYDYMNGNGRHEYINEEDIATERNEAWKHLLNQR